MRSNNQAVSYHAAYISERDVVILFSKLDALPHDNYSHSRWYSWDKGVWGHRNLPFMVKSAAEVYPKSKNPPYIIFSLGLISGAVEVYFPRGSRIEYEFLPGASLERGLLHLQQIKEIDGRLYVVGPDGQIFRRKLNESGHLVSFKGAQGQTFQGKMDQWEIFNQGAEAVPLSHFEAQGMNRTDAMSAFVRHCSFNSIDGYGNEHLYAVGADGAIIYRRTDKWEFLPKVTNSELRRVKQVDADTVFLAGDKGTLLRGNAKSGFSAIPTDMSEQLRALEFFNGKLYIGSIGRGVFAYDGKSISRVVNLPEFECHTLHSKDGQLLAVGEKEVYLTDDAIHWRALKNPDNE